MKEEITPIVSADGWKIRIDSSLKELWHNCSPDRSICVAWRNEDLNLDLSSGVWIKSGTGTVKCACGARPSKEILFLLDLAETK